MASQHHVTKAFLESLHQSEVARWRDREPVLEYPRWFRLACKIPSRWTPRFLEDKMADCYNNRMEDYRQWLSERP